MLKLPVEASIYHVSCLFKYALCKPRETIELIPSKSLENVDFLALNSHSWITPGGGGGGGGTIKPTWVGNNNNNNKTVIKFQKCFCVTLLQKFATDYHLK